MKRLIAHGQTWWIRAFVVAVLVLVFVDNPWWMIAIPLVLFALSLVRAPWDRERAPVEVDVPVRGRWVALNGPGTKVPSHGMIAYGQAFAIDILHPSGATEPKKFGWRLASRRADTYPSFASPVFAAADGTVVAAQNRQRDHRDRGSWPALIYLFVVEAFIRELGGAPFILGNHVIIEHGDGVFSAYAHLRRGSVRVRPGEHVMAGDHIGDVGNSGNTTEPHLHFQLMDDRHLTGAAGVPFRWRGVEIRSGDTDVTYATGPVSEELKPGLPADGQVFTAREPDRVTR